MSSCRYESDKLDQCRRTKIYCENEREELEKCRKVGLFYQVRSGTSGFSFRPSEHLEFNSEGPNLIFHESDHVIIGSQGVEFKFGSFKF